jgi:xylose dehydrogenase (NAD/NADP)
MEGFMWRHHPRTTQILEMVRRGEIGELRLIRSSFSFDIDRTDWRLDPRRGGGALWDVGCYGVNSARLFAAAEPHAVTAAAHWHTTGVDMTLAATLQFASGVLAQIDCSFEAPYRCYFDLVGSAGVLVAPGGYLPDDPLLITLFRDKSVETLPCASANQYAEMVDHFCEAVLSGRPLAPPAEDGLANMRVMDAVLAAARTHAS